LIFCPLLQIHTNTLKYPDFCSETCLGLANKQLYSTLKASWSLTVV